METLFCRKNKTITELATGEEKHFSSIGLAKKESRNLQLRHGAGSIVNIPDSVLSVKAENILNEIVDSPKRVLSELSLKINKRMNQGKNTAFDSLKKIELENRVDRVVNFSVPELKSRGNDFILGQADVLLVSANNAELIAHGRALNIFIQRT